MLQQTARKCPTFSSVWIIAINFLWFFAGILFIALSSWGIGQQKEDPVTAALPAGGLVTILVSGVFLMITAVIGWLGVRFNYNCCGRVTLGFYATILIILMIMEFSAAGAVLTFTGKVNNFGPAQASTDFAIYYLVNQSYASCCCNLGRCPNGTCWIPANLLYPCDTIGHFWQWLDNYLNDQLVPVCVICILIGLIQFFTAITACCNQCKGKTVEAQKKLTATGSMSYDGMYAEGEEAYSGYGYESYVKSGAARPGSAAAAAAGGGGGDKGGATAPKAPASGGGRPPAGGGGGGGGGKR